MGSQRTGRWAFVDSLRVALTALVVFHHAAITYGASGGWYLREAREGSDPLLVLFCTVNQAFFMGFFFLIAGTFTPPAYDRKGPRAFLRDRLVRLGLPLLAFGFVLDPATVALARARSPAGLLTRWGHMMAGGWFSSGPLWFAEALLIFAAGYTVWRQLSDPILGPPHRAIRPLPGHRALLVAAIGVGVGAFVLRLVFPVGWTVSNLQLGYFASYVVLFAAGVAGAGSGWLARVGRDLAHPWLWISGLALLVLLASSRLPGAQDYSGGWTARAAIYAFFEPFFAWGVILALLHRFHTRFDQPGPIARFLAARAYAVYIIHPPVLVGVTRLLHAWQAPALAKFAAAGSLACAGCVAVASLMLMIPGARRIL